ncbi:hypothetical protein [Gemmatimonas sp.]|uniref:hypothetical protein n=1 Tax=Gemmatimonas sp. TaxID=1962908 RepID=UPI003982EA1B
MHALALAAIPLLLAGMLAGMLAGLIAAAMSGFMATSLADSIPTLSGAARAIRARHRGRRGAARWHREQQAPDERARLRRSRTGAVQLGPVGGVRAHANASPPVTSS